MISAFRHTISVTYGVIRLLRILFYCINGVSVMVASAWQHVFNIEITMLNYGKRSITRYIFESADMSTNILVVVLRPEAFILSKNVLWPFSCYES